VQQPESRARGNEGERGVHLHGFEPWHHALEKRDVKEPAENRRGADVNDHNGSDSGEPIREQQEGLQLPSGPIALSFMEAWTWLEREGFLVPKPGDSIGTWVVLSRKAQAMTGDAELASYLQARIFPTNLNEVLMRLVRPMFLRGDYDTAVFRAFKEVEVQVREKGKLGNQLIGRELMVNAFGPTGPLTDKEAPKGEQDALRELFAGAISFCKNPSSHREVQFDDPREVVDLICFANQLLRIIERIPAPKSGMPKEPLAPKGK